jgi:hypothetical protein
MIRRFLFALMLLVASVSAEAGFYTDIWYKPSESGWGVNLVQTDNFIFATFFIYGTDGKPTWYTAHLNWNGVDAYTGNVIGTQGTFFGVPWIAGNLTHGTVGTASFTPSSANAYQATLSYSIPGVGSATNAIERQNLTTPALGANYVGGQAGAYTGCKTAANSGPYQDTFSLLKVTHFDNGTATFEFSYSGSLTCTFTGTLIQNGLLYRIPAAHYTCSDGLDTTASMEQLKSTSQGIEGVYKAADVGDSCAESASFSAAIF